MLVFGVLLPVWVFIQHIVDFQVHASRNRRRCSGHGAVRSADPDPSLPTVVSPPGNFRQKSKIEGRALRSCTIG